MHRLITGASYGIEVDHINGDRLDNRRSNLRLCTKAENTRNKVQQKHNRFGLKGVSFKCGKFYAQIQAHGKKYCLGYHSTPEEAHQAYCEAAFRLHGEFANTK